MQNVQLMVPAEIKTRLDGMNLLDRFLFEETVEDPEIYNAMVEILMDGESVMIVQTETEKELRVSPQLREIRLDVIGVEADGDIYQLEMQKKNTYNLPKRSRYYQAQMDVSLLKPGTKDFNELNDVTTILVAPFDIFGHGLYRYTFEGTCLEVPELRLQDGARRIFINTNGENSESFSQEFLDFMTYINESTEENAKKTASEKIKKIHSRVKKIKVSEKVGVKLMQKWEELAYAKEEGWKAGEEAGREAGEKIGREAGEKIGREAGEKIGRAAGEKAGREAALLSLVKDGLLSAEEAAKRLSVPEEEILEKIKKL